MQATSYVDLLPTELYPMIIEHIGFDLISHVYFSQLNARIEACYRCLGRAFWEPVCRASGLACQPAEHASLTNEDWADLAFECAGHALSCQHPACGMGRLRENERLMRKHVVDGLDLMDTLPRDDVRDVEPISVWKDIAFKSNVRWARSIDTWRNTTCLRIVEEGYIGRAGPLHEHPVIWRSFAAFPPVPKMNLCTIDIPDPSNDNGVIVADMLDAIIDR
ncbi:hypothetical protein BC835DRAFT_1356900 [Cytidiella melzeri]|nr:hypothetical protein BC835DRAFT_1356900 [Cytidiella melzeri]